VILSAEELLAGAELTYDVVVPSDLLAPALTGTGDEQPTIRLRPLRISDLQVIDRAAADQDQLYATLMVQRALVEPTLTIPQVAALPAGLVHHLLREVNRVSGLDDAGQAVASALEAPIAQAAFVLTRAFGWTPAQVNELTLGQVLLHLELLHREPEQ
jgi:hypothetical protein